MTKDEEVAKEKVQKFLAIAMEEMRRYSLISLLRQYSFTENDYEIVREWFEERGLEL